jgi:hypothetical protein
MTLRAVFYAALSATVLLTGCSHHCNRCPTTAGYAPVNCCPQPNPCNGTTGVFSAPAATVQPVPVAPVQAVVPNAACPCPR